MEFGCISTKSKFLRCADTFSFFVPDIEFWYTALVTINKIVDLVPLGSLQLRVGFPSESINRAD